MATSYTNIFGGTTSFPSQVSLRKVTLTANTTLVWPTEDATSGNVVARIMEVSPSAVSLSLTMPPANQTGVGNTVLFYGANATSYTVLDNSGVTIATVASGQFWQIYLSDNSTTAGTWRSGQFAVGTSTASAASLVGFGLVAITTTLNQAYPVTTKSGNYTFVAGDRAGMFVETGGVATFTLPAAATATNSWFVNVRNGGTGILTIATVGSDTINGSAAGGTISLNPTDSCFIVSDGTSAFYTVGIGQAVNFAWTFVSISAAGTGTLTLSGTQLNQSIYSFTGALTGNRTIVFPATVQQYTINNATTGAFTFTVQPTGGTGVVIATAATTIVYCDGTNMNNSDTAGVGVPVPIASGGTNATTAAAALANLGGINKDEAVALALIF